MWTSAKFISGYPLLLPLRPLIRVLGYLYIGTILESVVIVLSLFYFFLLTIINLH